jgi:hypothetical protein
VSLRRILQLLALAAIGVSILLMRPDETESLAPTDSMSEPLEPAQVPAEIEPDAPSTAVPSDSVPPPAATPTVTIMTREIPGDPGEPPLVPAFQLQKGELAWEKRVNDVLDNPKISDTDKGRLLLEMLPGLPVEGREITAEHAISRLDDADYRHAQGVLANPATYPPALAVLWSDLMGRPESISLPTLLTVARNASHPYAENARENLDLLLGQDFGTDWPRWEAAIREKLAKEPKR